VEKKELFIKIYSSFKKGEIFSIADLMISKSNSEHPKLLKAWKNLYTTTFLIEKNRNVYMALQ